MNRKVLIAIVAVIILALIVLAVINAPNLMDIILAAHGMR